MRIPKRKQWFLRIGGSAWELKIDPKRFRKKTKDDIEEGITKINETRPKRVPRGIWKPSRRVKKMLAGVVWRNARGRRGGL